MKHQIEMNIKEQFPNAREKNGTPAYCTYRIKYATGKSTQNENFRIVEQEYNGKHAYFNLIDVKNKEKFSLIFKTTCPDIFWLYLLRGTIQIEPLSSEPDRYHIHLQEGEYSLLYSSPREYKITFEPGEHLFLLFVVAAAWLQRYPIDDPTRYSLLIHHLKHSKKRSINTPALSIHSAIHKEMLRLFTLHAFEEMEMDAEVYSPIAKLISISREDLKSKTKSTSENTIEKLIQIRSYIKKNILNGSQLLIPDIAEHFNTNYRQLRLEYKRVYGDNLQSYITQKRLEVGARLLVETDDNITTIANKLGYDLKLFHRQFKYYYNVSPRQYRTDYKD